MAARAKVEARGPAKSTERYERLLHDGVRAARAARLEYTGQQEPGFGRMRRGKTFQYHDAKGRILRDRTTVERIRKLAIPPAWKDVWICPSPCGHIQATGRDARGRKQYKYHERFRALRDIAKYHHILRFGRTLPRLRRRLAIDSKQHTLTREKVVSAVIELMERTCMRVGNDQYAQTNKSYGLTTLRDRHAHLRGSSLELQFKGKSGKLQRVSVNDARLARIVRRCREVPGQRLFQYLGTDGRFHALTSGDVNDYLRQVTGEPFTAKDFRTWAGTVLAIRALTKDQVETSKTAKQREVKRALEQVSKELGNTVAVCRKSYVHPAVIAQYIAGELASALRTAERKARRRHVRGLRHVEMVVLHWLEGLPSSAVS